MTREEILKAMPMCFDTDSCDDCPYKPKKEDEAVCMTRLMKDAFELINTMQEQIKRQANNIHALLKMDDVEERRIKAEAIKEFADRIVEYIDVGHLRPATEICFSELDVQHIVEKIAKEMVGADNET